MPLGHLVELGSLFGEMAIGFSHSTCLPALAAASQRHMQMVRQRVVDGFDFRVGQHGLVGAIGLGNAELARHSWAYCCSREEMATISSSRLFSMPGRTFSMPILAVEIMPHFTGFMAFLLAVLYDYKGAISISTWNVVFDPQWRNT